MLEAQGTWERGAIAPGATLIATRSRAFCSWRCATRAHRLDIDDAFIVLAVGQPGVSPTSVGYAVNSEPRVEIAQLLDNSKKTIRRGAVRLAMLGFVSKRARGGAIKRIEEWLELAALVTTLS
jgi:hypothetical protein